MIKQWLINTLPASTQYYSFDLNLNERWSYHHIMITVQTHTLFIHVWSDENWFQWSYTDLWNLLLAYIMITSFKRLAVKLALELVFRHLKKKKKKIPHNNFGRKTEFSWQFPWWRSMSGIEQYPWFWQQTFLLATSLKRHSILWVISKELVFLSVTDGPPSSDKIRNINNS